MDYVQHMQLHDAHKQWHMKPMCMPVHALLPKQSSANPVHARLMAETALIRHNYWQLLQEQRQALEQSHGHGGDDSGSSPTGKEGPVVPPTPPGPSPFALTFLTEELAYNGESITYGA